MATRKNLFFSPLPLYCIAVFYFKAAGVTSVRQRGIYVEVQMEVTGDLSCGVTRLSNRRKIDRFDNEPQLFVLISSSLMLFPKCGHLLAKGPGAYNVAAFKKKKKIFSQLKMSAVCMATAQKQSSKVFCIPPGRLKAWVTQPATLSVGNVGLMLQAECAELFAWLDWQCSGVEARWKQSTRMQDSLLWWCYCCFPCLHEKLVPFLFKQLLYILQGPVPLIPQVVLQLAFDRRS